MSLTELHLANNRLVTLPHTIGCCSRLTKVASPAPPASCGPRPYINSKYINTYYSSMHISSRPRPNLGEARIERGPLGPPP